MGPSNQWKNGCDLTVGGIPVHRGMRAESFAKHFIGKVKINVEKAIKVYVALSIYCFNNLQNLDLDQITL